VQVASRAELVARGSAISGSEVRILVEVAGVLARAGEHARAVQVARDITNPDFRVRALVEVASAFAQAGKPGQAVQVATRAEQVARGIADPGFRAQVLVKVAGALTLADARRRATHLLGSALGLGDWTRLPLAAIADINQDVINAIGRAAASNGNG
jgi:lipopolysaccharide biosynthesis regulator YciM